MSDNDNDGEGPTERTPREQGAHLDLKRRMRVILPQLQQFFMRLDTEVEAAKRESRPVDYDGLAVEYRLWRDAADHAIAHHWNQYEQGLTVAEREEQLPHAAEDFAQETRRLNEYEEWGAHVKGRVPQKTVRQNEELFTEFERVGQCARLITTTNVDSFAARAIKKSGKSDLPAH